MDPNANLKEQAFLLTHIGPADGSADRAMRRRVAELRRALAAWIARGGFAPDWTAYPEATKAYRAWGRKLSKFQDLAR